MNAHVHSPVSIAVAQLNLTVGDLAGNADRIIAALEDARAAGADLLLTPEFSRALERRLKALVFGKDIRVTSIRTREAPAEITIAPLLLHRIIDNLFLNASKYTDRGSIIVELEGRPGFLVLKLSDTGRGIATEDLERTFSPGGSDPALRVAGSHGMGLSVVVQLLAELGGRLEVMSKGGFGTTIWTYLPVQPPERPPSSERAEPFSETLSRVVTIRKIA